MKIIDNAMRGLAGAGFLVFAASAFAQPAPSGPAFEVASVRPAAPVTDGHVMRRIGGDPGRVDYSNIPLTMLIARAYNVKEYQISGGPDWLGSAGYDVVAKLPAGASQDQVPAMLQALLAERFKLTLHRVSKEIPVYALIVSKNGPKLTEADPNAPLQPPPNIQHAIGGAVKAAGGYGPGGGPPLPPPPPGVGPGRGPVVMMAVGPRGRTLRGQMTMAQFANTLSNFMDRPVLDLTELTKTYDIDLTWAPDETDQMQSRLPMLGMAAAPGGGIAGGGPGAPGESKPESVAEPAGSIVSAVDGLGLRLDPRKSPAEVLVIDHVEKIPTEN